MCLLFTTPYGIFDSGAYLLYSVCMSYYPHIVYTQYGPYDNIVLLTDWLNDRFGRYGELWIMDTRRTGDRYSVAVYLQREQDAVLTALRWA